MHDAKGYHKIGNPGDTPAVTLHVYSPPFKAASKVNMDGSKELCYITYDTEGGVPPQNSDHGSNTKIGMTDEDKCAPSVDG